MKSTRLFAALTPSALGALVPTLRIGSIAQHRYPWASSVERDALVARGWGTVRVTDPVVGRLREAIDLLHKNDLPLVVVYAFDEAWAIGDAVARAVSEELGASYELVADFWAFRIPPGSSGWPPHRGVDERLDRALPEVVNVWVALSDAEKNRSCMHFVPLDNDPAFLRGDLTDLSAAATAGLAIPCHAATALYWNANVVHWGGACSVDVHAPRISMTFTLARADTVADGTSLRIEHLDPWDRLDMIADQVLTYASMASVTPDLLAWAQTSATLRIKMRGR